MIVKNIFSFNCAIKKPNLLLEMEMLIVNWHISRAGQYRQKNLDFIFPFYVSDNLTISFFVSKQFFKKAFSLIGMGIKN